MVFVWNDYEFIVFIKSARGSANAIIGVNANYYSMSRTALSVQTIDTHPRASSD